MVGAAWGCRNHPPPPPSLPPIPGYLGLYVFYVFTVVLCTWIHRRQRGEGLAPPGPWEPGKGLPAVPTGPPACWGLPLPPHLLSSSPQRCRQMLKSRSPPAQTAEIMVRRSRWARGRLRSVLGGPWDPRAAACVIEPMGRPRPAGQGDPLGAAQVTAAPYWKGWGGGFGGPGSPPSRSATAAPRRRGVPAPHPFPGDFPADSHRCPQPLGLPQVEEEALVLAALQGPQGE